MKPESNILPNDADEKEKTVVEWIGMLISILAMLAFSLWGKQSQPIEEEPTDSSTVKRAADEEEEFLDDEEPERKQERHVPVSPAPRDIVYKRQIDSTKRSVHAQSYARKQTERLLSANYRLKNALEGFQQRRPLDQKREKNAIERRTLDTKVVSESLRVDADFDARGAARLKKHMQLTEAGTRLRNGMIWSQILQPPIALRKGPDLL